MKHAFSLVELSIVLVIIGLLTGGILTGQNLIRASEIRTTIRQYDQYQTAVNTFREQYGGYPGDLKTAEDYWGTSAATDSACYQTAAVGTATCNGNGSGLIENGQTGRSNETYRFWQHLANAGMIEGNFTGVAASSVQSHSEIGVNVPAGKAKNTGWGIRQYTLPGSLTKRFAVPYGNAFEHGANRTESTTLGKAYTPKEVRSMDVKVDDGMPALGDVIVFGWTECSLATASDELDVDYRLDNKQADCSVIFRNLF
jgi:prepilin-type N-terminal cleavage/methylation domain-containing protein